MCGQRRRRASALIRDEWHAYTLINLEDWSFLKPSFRDSKSTAMIAHTRQELAEKFFLARASPHQWPLVGPLTIGIVGAGNKELGFIKFYHLVMEKIGWLGSVGFGMRRSRTAEAISVREEDEVEWLNFKGLLKSQTDI